MQTGQARHKLGRGILWGVRERDALAVADTFRVMRITTYNFFLVVSSLSLPSLYFLRSKSNKRFATSQSATLSRTSWVAIAWEVLTNHLRSYELDSWILLQNPRATISVLRVCILTLHSASGRALIPNKMTRPRVRTHFTFVRSNI